MAQLKIVKCFSDSDEPRLIAFMAAKMMNVHTLVRGGSASCCHGLSPAD